MLIAALCADGLTEIGNVRQIDRGYERIDERLRELGARITRLEDAPVTGVIAPHRAIDRIRVIDRIPSGTRDVLPDEMRELRAVTDRVGDVFERAGYGEVATPALEYEGSFARIDMAESRPAYRVFDEQGNVLVLRSDMTIPIARLVATRYAHAEPPFRFCYFAHAYRGVRPQRGQSREFLQAGVELIGAPGPHGTAEVLGVLCAALDAAGLETYRIGLGDASLYPALLESLGVQDAAARADPDRAGRGQLRRGRAGGRPPRASTTSRRSCCCACPRTRGGAEVLEDLDDALARRAQRTA